jgi:voltage-gated potassium channel
VDDLQRQIRIALFAFLIIIPTGIAGFIIIEEMNPLDALYFTFITLSTIGYGDISPLTPAGKIFTMTLIVFGLSSFAFGAQAMIGIITSPVIRNARLRRQTQNKINHLSGHYIICGSGELVDRTIEYVLQGALFRRDMIQQRQYKPIDDFLDRLLGDDDHGHHLWLRIPVRRLAIGLITLLGRQETILDVLVVITQDSAYAERLKQSGLLVIEGNPTDDESLESAGIQRALAMMVLLESDTETLLTVLAAHTLAPTVRITASVQDDDLGRKIIRVGASSVLTPFDIAGQFLNNATLRPAVSHFFNGLIFEHAVNYTVIELPLYNDSPWIGKPIKELNLRERFDASIIGIYYDNATYGYTPSRDYQIKEDETLIAVAPSANIEELERACRGENRSTQHNTYWQALPYEHEPVKGARKYSLEESEKASQQLNKHFIITGNDRVAPSAIARLDPQRPFVIISDDETLTNALLERGFRVIHGKATSEEVLLKAGIKSAQAIMVSQERKADSVLTVLSSRALNRSILITATANTDDMIEKLERAGADQVVSPFHVAARFVLLETTQPRISGFLNYVLYNYATGLETTEIYMEDDALWIGKTIEEIDLYGNYQAGVIGIRKGTEQSYLYAPSREYRIAAYDVLIVVTPMQQSDRLRDAAHGGTIRRPTTLRSRVLQNPAQSATNR